VTNSLKLSDFGTSKQVDDMTGTIIGTEYYKCPAIYQNKSYDPFLADLWSLGIFLYEIATGRVPYDADSREALKKVVAKRKITYPKKAKLSPCIKDLIDKMIVKGNITF